MSAFKDPLLPFLPFSDCILLVTGMQAAPVGETVAAEHHAPDTICLTHDANRFDLG